MKVISIFFLLIATLSMYGQCCNFPSEFENRICINVATEAQLKINDTQTSNDNNCMTEIEFQCEDRRVGEVGFTDPTDPNLHITNCQDDGYIEFQTECTTKASITPDGWFQINSASLWLGNLNNISFNNAAAARAAGFVDGQVFVDSNNGQLIALGPWN